MNAAALRQELAARHVTLTVSDTGKLKYEAPDQLPLSLVEAMKEHRAELLSDLAPAEVGHGVTSQDPAEFGILRHLPPVPALPSTLASMVGAAASGNISGGAKLPSGIVVDLGVYVLAWAAAYLTGDYQHALARLEEARGAWKTA